MRMRIQTGSPDEAHDWLRRAYSDHSVRLSGRRSAFRFSHQVAECGPLRVGVCRHTMTLEGRWQPLGGTLLFSHLLQGCFTVRSRTAEIVAGVGDVIGYDPDAELDAGWSDIRMAQVRIDRGAADRVAAETAGADRGTQPVAWHLGRPSSAARAQHWRRLMRYVSTDVLSEPELVESPLVMRAVQRHVIVTALQTFPNSTLAGPAAPPGGAAPAAVRRALDFIDEHAASDIDLTAIAEAAHVGPRALQRAFRRALDVTPLEHLRSVRLDRAHADLVAADPAVDTVAAIAQRWGFGHAGRFAKDYRERFRRSPSDTLRG
jgi:AraC-like DNA-binding protein